MQLFLSIICSVGVAFYLCKFITPAFFRKVPIPAHIFPAANILLLMFIWGFTFGVFYFFSDFVIDTSIDKNEVGLADNPVRKSKNTITNRPGESTARSTSSKHPAIQILCFDALQQGTDFSLTITSLSNSERVYQGAKNLLKISPRYKEQVISIEKRINKTELERDRFFRYYIAKVIEMARYEEHYLSPSFKLIRNKDLTPRQRMVADLLEIHVKSAMQGSQADTIKWFSDFKYKFENFSD